MIVTGTGHRPNKLGGKSAPVTAALIRLAAASLKRYDASLLITGMALGWDQALADAAIQIGIPFHAYPPFWGQQDRWPMVDQKRYVQLIEKAEKVVTASEGGYSAWKMQKRNELMVDAGGMLLALWNGSEGGTANCVGYAAHTGVRVVNVWPSWEKWMRERRAA